MDNNKIYNTADIHQYLSGKMNEAEMHAIEKAALDDPMLAEAIEGYHSLPGFTTPEIFENVKTQLDNLKEKINEGADKTTPVKRMSNTWRAAAAILLLLGGTALAIYLNNKIKPDNTTVAKVEPKNNITDNTITPSTDSVREIVKNGTLSKSNEKILNADKTVKNVLVVPQTSTWFNDKKVEKERIPESDDQTLFSTNTAPAPATGQEYDQITSSQASENLGKKKVAQNKDHNQIFSGKVTDKNNEPIGYTTITTNKGQVSTTNMDGFFSLPLDKANADKVTFNAKNFQPKTIAATNGFQNIILEPKKITNNLNLSAKRGQAIVLYNNGAEPKEGWINYTDYLVNKISYSEYDTGKPVVGETIVGFEVDAILGIHNFAFEKQIDSDVNDAIENIILTGPEWKVFTKTALPATIKLKLIF